MPHTKFEDNLTPEQTKYLHDNLGKVPDAQIAAELRTYPQQICAIRNRLGVSSYREENNCQFSIHYWTPERAKQFLDLWCSGQETITSLMEKMGLRLNINIHIQNLRMAGYNVPPRKKLRCPSICLSCEYYIWIRQSHHNHHICTAYNTISPAVRFKKCEIYRNNCIKNRIENEKIIF